MGYTHYFPQRREIGTRTFRRIARDLEQLIGSRDNRIPPLAWESGMPLSAPEYSDELIRFNGVGEDGHETFYLPIKHEGEPRYPAADRYRRYGFNFCKTARKPYDIVVCATLLIAHHHAKTWLEIGSDGIPEEWQPAVELVADVLGYTPALPPRIEWED